MLSLQKLGAERLTKIIAGSRPPQNWAGAWCGVLLEEVDDFHRTHQGNDNQALETAGAPTIQFGCRGPWRGQQHRLIKQWLRFPINPTGRQGYKKFAKWPLQGEIRDLLRRKTAWWRLKGWSWDDGPKLDNVDSGSAVLQQFRWCKATMTSQLNKQFSKWNFMIKL